MRLCGTGFFGKLPTAGDFQKWLPAEGPDGRTLEWFHDGWSRLALAGQRPDPQAPVRFVWQRPATALAVFGALVPSRDRAGRRFPLLVFGTAREVESTAQVLAAAPGFFARATAVAEAGRAGLDVPALREHVGSLRTGLDADGEAQQAAWLATTTAAAWADGTPGGLPARLRAIDYAFSGGRRPNFVLRGRWQGDLRHLAAGAALLQRLGQQVPGMLFWQEADGGIAWRLSFDYAVPSHFEALLWHDCASGAAFDTDPGAVPIPASFAARTPMPAAGADLGSFLTSR
ncbi:MAG: type VI secretion system-associated protein TagF [Planctomycetes bacterium]|nr:type VI secretion system-associated protein TagF [Planctomycetota bacterium]